jgi:ABC-type long-subunit fatty acid transport system fused permease/ATPase subunit
MGSLLSDVFGLVIAFFVSAIVWATLAAGLYQLVRKEVRQFRVMPQRPRRLKQYSQQAG